jgi:hypothetical protein
VPAIINESFCSQPKDTNAKIWRYMTFDKFLWLLEKKKLYFARLDRFEDPFEGKIFKKTIEKYIDQRIFIEPHSSSYNYLIDHANNSFIIQSLTTFISCWNLSDIESMALWKIFSKEKNSICIQSTYATLCSLLDNDVYLGVVSYEDANPEESIHENMISYLFRKRKFFQYENEVRAVIRKYNEYEQQILDKRNYDGNSLIRNKVETSVHINLPINTQRSIDPHSLISKIIVNPESEDWFFEFVKETVIKYFGFTQDQIKESDLKININEVS